MCILGFFQKKKKPIKEGTLAPNFFLRDAKGEMVQLLSYQGKKNVVLYFYPADNTYHCIAESVKFRENSEKFENLDAEIIGVSSDNQESHAAFAKKYQLPFHLLSDTDQSIRNLYGVPPVMGVIPGRTTYVIDKEGIVRQVFSSLINVDSHVDLALKKIKEIEEENREEK